jgi:hypothetical protein
MDAVVETVVIVLVTWGLYAIPFFPIAGTVWDFGRKRVQWNRWDFAVILFPSTVWAVAMMIDGTGKSLSNLVLEVPVLGCIAPIAPIVRVVVGRHANEKILAIGLFIVICLAAIGLWAFVPGLPE